MISSGLLIAQADLAVVRLIRAAIAPPKTGGGGPVLEPDLLPPHRRSLDTYEPCRLGDIPRPLVYTTTPPPPPRIEITLGNAGTPPPLDPGAFDLRDITNRRKETSLPAPWATLPPVAESATTIQHHYRQLNINNARELKGTTIDLFC